MTEIATIEMDCKVPLPEQIVLATQDDISFPQLRWSLPNGDEACVELDLDEEMMRRAYEGQSTATGGVLNSKAEHLRVTLTMKLSTDEFQRLTCTHKEAKLHHAKLAISGENVDFDYQDAEEFGNRVYQEIREAINYVLEIIRDTYGQHWLKLIGEENSGLQHFLMSVHASYRFEKSEEWKPLLVARFFRNLGTYNAGGARNFLEISDWLAIQDTVKSGAKPHRLLTLLSEAKDRFEQGDKQLALIHLSSSLELAVRSYLSSYLQPKIPQKPLDLILEQTHGRLLEDWVKPLNTDIGTGITDQEWRAVKDVQKLRKKAGHVFAAPEVESLSASEFRSLLYYSSAFISRLTGAQQLKNPFQLLMPWQVMGR